MIYRLENLVARTREIIAEGDTELLVTAQRSWIMKLEGTKFSIIVQQTQISFLLWTAPSTWSAMIRFTGKYICEAYR